jgi:hypothetical protein
MPEITVRYTGKKAENTLIALGDIFGWEVVKSKTSTSENRGTRLQQLAGTWSTMPNEVFEGFVEEGLENRRNKK